MSLSQFTWFGDQVGIQISGMCPSANRSKRDNRLVMGNLDDLSDEEGDGNSVTDGGSRRSDAILASQSRNNKLLESVDSNPFEA